MSRVDGPDLDQSGRQEPLDLGHRGHEALAPWPAQRLQKRTSELVAPPVEHLPLGKPGWCELHSVHAPVVRALLHAGQPGILQRAEKAAEIPRIEVEPGPQPAHVASLYPDLPEQTRLPERPVPGQIAIFERADPLREESVEAANLADGIVYHSLILVREERTTSRLRSNASAR